MGKFKKLLMYAAVSSAALLGGNAAHALDYDVYQYTSVSESAPSQNSLGYAAQLGMQGLEEIGKSLGSGAKVIGSSKKLVHISDAAGSLVKGSVLGICCAGYAAYGTVESALSLGKWMVNHPKTAVTCIALATAAYCNPEVTKEIFQTVVNQGVKTGFQIASWGMQQGMSLLSSYLTGDASGLTGDASG